MKGLIQKLVRTLRGVERKMKSHRLFKFMNFTIGLKLLPAKIRFISTHMHYLKTEPQEIRLASVLLFAHDNNRGAFKNGLPYAQLLDSFGDALEEKGLSVGSLAKPFAKWTGSLAYRNPFSMNREHYWYSLYMGTRNSQFHLKRINAACDFYLRQAGVKVVIACSPTLSIIRAAKRNGIAIYELMHGMGYTNIDQSYSKRKPEELPDYFLSMDRVTTNTLKRVVNEERIVPVRHPWLSIFEDPKGIRPEWILPQSVINRLKSFDKVVLFSLQWGYDGEKDMFAGIIENGIMHSSVVKAIEKSSDDVAWILRLHPVQMMDPRYKHHISFLNRFEREHPNVLGCNLSGYPIASVLAVSDAHITMCSMVCYEAAWLGVPSLALCPVINKGGALGTYFDDLREAGIVDKFPVGEADINAWIRNASRRHAGIGGIFYDEPSAIEHVMAHAR